MSAQNHKAASEQEDFILAATEKCRDERRSLYIAFVDHTKAFDLVSRNGLFTLLEKIGSPPNQLSMITSFHENKHGTVQYDGSSSKGFPTRNGVKQGCVFVPILFEVFFSLLSSYALVYSSEGVWQVIQPGPSACENQTKVRQVLIREMLLAEDAALILHTEEGLQKLIDQFAQACTEFGLAISLKKTNIVGQEISQVPAISIDDRTLEVVQEFTYLESTITSKISLKVEINKRIEKAASAMSRLSKTV